MATELPRWDYYLLFCFEFVSSFQDLWTRSLFSREGTGLGLEAFGQVWCFFVLSPPPLSLLLLMLLGSVCNWGYLKLYMSVLQFKWRIIQWPRLFELLDHIVFLKNKQIFSWRLHPTTGKPGMLLYKCVRGWFGCSTLYTGSKKKKKRIVQDSTRQFLFIGIISNCLM